MAKITKKQLEALRRTKTVIEKFLAQGCPPPGADHKDRLGNPGAVLMTSREMRLPFSTIKSRVEKGGTCERNNLPIDWTKYVPKQKAEKSLLGAMPAATRVFLLTAAQDDTSVDHDAWENLQAYAAHRSATIYIGGFTYQKGLFESHAVATGVFRKELIPFLNPEIVNLAPRLVWYGRANILPTAVDPLTGWDTQTRGSWAIFPHAKIALKSIPVMPEHAGKQIMTTGVITKPNYIQRNAGQKAEFHHTPGATVVEVKPNGTFFVRQISMNRDGSFQDLDMFVRNGKIEAGPPVEAITWGDIHFEELDPDVARVAWGYDMESRRCSDSSMLNDLRPKYQFFHDSFDFKPRSHHTRSDPHERVSRIVEGNDSVSDMLSNTARFLQATQRDWCKSVHVASNHNMHLEYWLKDPVGHFDPVNALIWHKLNAAWFAALESKDEYFSAHAHALQNAGFNLSDIVFLRQGQSFTICQGTAPIECGMHADVGPRGAKGSPSAMAKIVERMNGGHTHEPCIKEAAFYAGTSSRMPSPSSMRYAARGPNAWHQSEIITYQSGKRAIVTLQNGEYRA